jgi:RDD family
MANWLNIAVGYLTFSWSATGRSVGKQIAGLRVVDRGGQRLSLWRWFARAVLYVLLPAGLLWILASRRNASLQDLIVGRAVVYDWAHHPADEPHPTDHGHSPGPAHRRWDRLDDQRDDQGLRDDLSTPRDRATQQAGRARDL